LSRLRPSGVREWFTPRPRLTVYTRAGGTQCRGVLGGGRRTGAGAGRQFRRATRSAQCLEHRRPGVPHEPGQVAGLAGSIYRDRRPRRIDERIPAGFPQMIGQQRVARTGILSATSAWNVATMRDQYGATQGEVEIAQCPHHSLHGLPVAIPQRAKPGGWPTGAPPRGRHLRPEHRSGVARTISRPSSRLGTTGSTNVGAGRVAGIRSSKGRAVAGKARLARMTQRPGTVPVDGRLSSRIPADTSASGAGASLKRVSSRSSVVKRTRVNWSCPADPGPARRGLSASACGLKTGCELPGGFLASRHGSS
jgi:hypothetical protein